MPGRLHQYRLGQPKDRNCRCRDSVVAVVPGLDRGLAARFPRGGLWQADVGEGEWTRLRPDSASAVSSRSRPRGRAGWCRESDPTATLEDSDLRIIQVIWALQVGPQPPRPRLRKPEETLFGIVRWSLDGHRREGLPYLRPQRTGRPDRRPDRPGVEALPGRDQRPYLAGLLHDVGMIGIPRRGALQSRVIWPRKRGDTSRNTGHRRGGYFPT